MKPPDQSETNLNNSLTAAQLLKTKLEIDALRHQSRWEVGLARFIPTITTLVAVLGLIFTFWQAHQVQTRESEDREKTRINTIQAQIRADKEQLREYVWNDKASATEILFALDDLSTLVRQLPSADAEVEQVTRLLDSIAYELRFNEKRDVYFDVQALQRWPSYRENWKRNANYHHEFLMQKYHAKIARAFTQDPVCIQSVDYDGDKLLFTSPNITEPCQDGLLVGLLWGFQEHLKAIHESANPALMQTEIAELAKVTNDSAFAKHLSAYFLSPEGPK